MTASNSSLIVVGAGKWGTNHIKTARSLGLLKAIVDSNQQALNAVAKTLGPKNGIFFYDSLSEALLVLPDASVIIATPPSTHFALAKQAIDSRRHVLVEKPLCQTLQQGAELTQLAENANVILMVDHLLHYSVDHCKLLHLVASGVVGEVTRVRMSRMNFGTVRTEENVLWSLSPHDISILLKICDNQLPSKVSCIGQRVVSSTIEDYIDMSLSFDSGIQAQIEASWMHPQKERRTVVYGSKGCAILNEAMPDPGIAKLQVLKWSAKRKRDGTGVSIEKSEEDLMQILENEAAKGVEFKHLTDKSPLQAVIEHFAHCIATNNPPETDGQEGVRVLKVLSAASESLMKEGMAVLLPNASPIPKTYIHSTAVVDQGAILGKGTKVWHFSHIMSGATLGESCNIGQNAYIGGKATLGRNVKVQNNVSIYDAVNIADDVFLGPSCVLTNVKTPRSHISRKHAFSPTSIGKGTTIGANSTIVCGIRIGTYAFVGAGAVVTKDVPAHALVYGNPATIRGWVSSAGVTLREVADVGEGRKVLQCTESKEVYTLYPGDRDGCNSPSLVKSENSGIP